MKANSHETGAGDWKEVYLNCQQFKKMWDSCPKAHLSISVQTEVYIGRKKGSRTKRSRGGRDVDVQVVSLLVPIWIFNISIPGLVCVSQILQLSDLHQPKSWSKPFFCLFFVQTGTETADACLYLNCM